jgi:hypothetical protein
MKLIRSILNLIAAVIIFVFAAMFWACMTKYLGE